MSEEYYTSVTAYSEPLAQEVARAAGLSVQVSESLQAGFVALLDRIAAASARSQVQLLEALGEAPADAQRNLQGMGSALDVLSRRRDLELFRAALEAEAGRSLSRMTGELRQLAESRPEARNAAESSVGAAFGKAALRLLDGIGRVNADAVRGAIAECGYSDLKEVDAGGGRRYFSGASNGTGLRVEVDAKRSMLNLDISGLRGTTCEGVRQRFLGALEKRGIRLRIEHRHLHGDPRGGSLIRRTDAAFSSATHHAFPLVPRLREGR
jgi:hypothetical protein